MAAAQRIKIDPPLATVRKMLRAVDASLPKELQKTNKAIANVLAEDIRDEYQRQYPRDSGRGARSIRGLATATSAKIAMGGKKAPYVLGQNFGSLGGPNKKQFARGENRDPDRVLFTTVADAGPEIEDEYLEMINDLMARAFPKGRR